MRPFKGIICDDVSEFESFHASHAVSVGQHRPRPWSRHYGYPLKLRIPTKLGFKNPKWITTIFVTNRFPGGFWEDRGYNWFAGV